MQILIEREELTLEGIEQYVITYETEEQKLEKLLHLLSNLSFKQTIIYCNLKKSVLELADRIKE